MNFWPLCMLVPFREPALRSSSEECRQTSQPAHNAKRTLLTVYLDLWSNNLDVGLTNHIVHEPKSLLTLGSIDLLTRSTASLLVVGLTNHTARSTASLLVVGLTNLLTLGLINRIGRSTISLQGLGLISLTVISHQSSLNFISTSRSTLSLMMVRLRILKS